LLARFEHAAKVTQSILNPKKELPCPKKLRKMDL
jgi:hypothetical protein